MRKQVSIALSVIITIALLSACANDKKARLAFTFDRNELIKDIQRSLS